MPPVDASALRSRDSGARAQRSHILHESQTDSGAQKEYVRRKMAILSTPDARLFRICWEAASSMSRYLVGALKLAQTWAAPRSMSNAFTDLGIPLINI